MRRISSRGVFAPSRWIYVTNVVADRMKHVASTQTVEEPNAGIPHAVYVQIMALLKYALELKNQSNSGGSDYRLHPPSTSGAARSLMARTEEVSQFQRLLEKFSTTGPITPEDAAMARRAQEFFSRLSREGEAEVLRQDARSHVSALSRRL